MNNKFLFDALKVPSERYINFYKKENTNFIKLLKKTKRQYVVEYKKGLTTKDDLLKIYEKCNKFIEELHNSRIGHLGNLIDKFVQIRSAKSTKCHLTVNKIDLQQPNDEVTNVCRPLISVNEEMESPTNLNKTLTIEPEMGYETINNDMEITEECVTDLETLSEARDVVIENSCHFNKDNHLNLVDTHVQVSLEDISHQPIKEMDESIDVVENKMADNNIPYESVVNDNNRKSFQEVQQTENKSGNSIILNKAGNNIIDSSELTNSYKTISASADSYISSIESSNEFSRAANDTRNNSTASSLSINKTLNAKTPISSGLFKSKFHTALDSSQKLTVKSAAKMHVNSSMKRKAEDVQNQKKIQDDRKHHELLAKAEEHERKRNMAKLTANAKALASNKMAPVVAKVAPKVIASTSKDKTKTEPRLILSSIKVAQPKMALPSTLKTSTVLKPINKAPSLKLPMPSLVATGNNDNVPFKTPLAEKNRPVLTDSCRKIVIDHNSYSLNGLDSDNSDDEETDVGQVIPAWTNKQSGTLSRLSEYHSNNTDPRKIFYPSSRMEILIEEVFADYKFHDKPRSSSAIWK